ncbi:hypothetical protein [Streptomyces sp. NPDC059479]|uniref:hypothetical protein n=1 Tax=Streptomyces sp. NPDC059479 TaxID=3346848 RepID=UPI003673B52C
MAREQTVMQEPVHLLEPAVVEPPKPRPGCDVCNALLGQWRQATEPDGPAHDSSHAIDLAIEIRRHPHPGKTKR